MAYSDDILNPYLRGAILLLKKQQSEEPILFGNIYFVQLRGIQLFRIVKRYDLNPEVVTLATLQPSTLGEIDVGVEAIKGLWLAVGAISRLAR